MSNRTVYVALDMMVYLHYRPADQLDLATVLSSADTTILVPRITIHELDVHKNTHQSPKIRERARKRLVTLQQWIKKGEVCPGLAIEFAPRRPDIDFTAYGLNAQWNDDHLLATIIQFKAERPDNRVVLLTQDTGLLLAAQHVGIESVAIDDGKRLPQEVDPFVRENQELKNELLRLKTAQPVLIIRLQGMADDVDHATFELSQPSQGSTPDKDAFLAELRDGLPEKHPPPPLSKTASSLAVTRALAMPFGEQIPKSEYDRYNRDRETYVRNMSDYLDRLAAYRTQPDRTLLLKLEMRNAGTVPAEDVDISLHFPDGFELYSEDDLPGQPREPEPPTPPQTDLQKRMAGISVNLARAYLPRLGNIGPADPFSLQKTNSYDLSDHVARLKHGCAYDIRRLYLVFPSYETAKSFSFDYRLAAANLPTPATGEVHIVVEKA